VVVVTREIRRDPTTGEEVVLSSERTLERRPPSPPDDPQSCPFCPGQERFTRPTIAAVERAGAWVARAFANRRPVLVVEEALSSRDGLLQSTSGVGAHEVIVEAPEHVPLHHLPVERTVDALTLATLRMQDLRRDMRLQTLSWFRNHGVGAGASQAHPHAQVVGLPVVPRRVAAFRDRCAAHRARTGRPLMQELREVEARAGRLVLEQGPVMAFCPFAPRHPFEVWLVPDGAGPHLADATPAQLEATARAMHAVLGALERGVGPTPLTALAFGAPAQEAGEGIGWHIRLAPRLLVGAGLEEATGLAVHSVFPEEAAEVLRSALSVKTR
jgi:UDPglucose--hexose-1-phosphate uridylyltransferase